MTDTKTSPSFHLNHRLVLLILLASVLEGIFLGMVSGPYVAGTYSLRWDNAQWVGPAEHGAVAYYRKSIVLDWLPARATLWLAAPDGFEVSVNGNQVGLEHFISINTAGIYDIGPYLTVGANQIAVKVTRGTYGGSPLLLLQAEIVSRTGEKLILLSDQTWRMNTRQEYQRRRTVAWTSVAFDDSGWGHAKLQVPEQDRPIRRLATPLEVFTLMPRGVRIWRQNDGKRNATFVRHFDWRSGRLDQAWLGVSSTGDYLVTVNNVALAPREASGKYMDVFDIGPYVQSGTNVVTIQVSNLAHESHLLVSGLAGAADEWVDFSSDEHWNSVPVVPVETVSSKLQLDPVRVVFDGPESLAVLAAPTGTTTTSLRPILRVVPLDSSAMAGTSKSNRASSQSESTTGSVQAISSWMTRYLPWIFVMFATNLAATLLFIRVAYKRYALEKSQLQALSGMSHMIGAIFFAVAFYLRYDVRLDPRALLNYPIFFLLLLLTFLPLATALAESRRGVASILNKRDNKGGRRNA